MYGPPRCRARTIERHVHGHGPLCLAPAVHDHSCPGELALSGGGAPPPDLAPANWAGNVEFRAAEVRRPRTVTGLRSMVAGSTHVRALGTRHSFSRIADTNGVLLATAGLPAVCDIDSAAAAVTVGSGVTYGGLAHRLNAAGW